MKITTTMILVILTIFMIGCSAGAKETVKRIEYSAYKDLLDKYNDLVVRYSSLLEKISNLSLNNQQLELELDKGEIYEDAFEECYEKLKDKKTTWEEYNELKEKYSYYYGGSFSVGLTDNKEIIELAKTLRKNTVEDTISNIENWVNDNIEYEFFQSTRSLEVVLRTKEGDCSDKSSLMYELLWLNNIPAKKIHCYVNNRKHDSIEILYPLEDWLYWKPFDKNCEKVGEGFW